MAATATPDTGERWAKLRKYPCYRVSPAGTVQSKWRRADWVELTPQPDRDGRPFVGLFNDDSNGKAFHASVARLVLEAFERKPKKGEVAGYHDFDVKNVALGNVFWSTRSELMLRKNAAKALAAANGAAKKPAKKKAGAKKGAGFLKMPKAKRKLARAA